MADEKETKKKASDPQVDQPVTEGSPKPKARRSPARKTSAKAEEKPKRTRTAAKAKEGEEKPKTPARRRAAPKAKAPEAEAAAERAGAEPEEKAEAPKAPARRRRPAPQREAPEAPPTRPVVTARAKYVRSSARKARLVLDHIRGKEIGEARAVLRHSPRGIAREIERLLDSAVANAEKKHRLGRE